MNPHYSKELIDHLTLHQAEQPQQTQNITTNLLAEGVEFAGDSAFFTLNSRGSGDTSTIAVDSATYGAADIAGSGITENALTGAVEVVTTGITEGACEMAGEAAGSILGAVGEAVGNALGDIIGSIFDAI